MARQVGLPLTRRRSWGMILVGLAIAYSPSYLNVLLRWVGVQWGSNGPPSVILWNWLAVGVLVTFVVLIERRGLSSLLLKRPSWKDLEWAVIFWGISTAVSGVFSAILPLPPSEGLDRLLAIPLPVLIALILTTATTEEVLYRAYPIERLRELTGRRWLAVVGSFLIFVLPHLTFFGPQWLIYNGVSVVLLYVLYMWRRNLWACMTMHFLGNALILLPATGIVR